MAKVDISTLDSNFKAAEIGGVAVEFRDVRTAGVEITGVLWDDVERVFARLPTDVITASGNDGLRHLGRCSAGGQVRFCTDSPVIALHYTLYSEGDMPHMPRSGSAGFDLFHRGNHLATCWAETAQEVQKTTLLRQGLPAGLREYTLNLPLYNGVRDLQIGIAPGCRLNTELCEPRKKIVFYGSSITQGGCASRPGNAYTSMICRWLNLEQVNLGFSGNAHGEPALAGHIASLDPDLLVLDYDHNAPTEEHLRQTHEPFFKLIRKAHPGLPVIFVSKPDRGAHDSPESIARRRGIIFQTYMNAHQAGDRNVEFVDGQTLFDGPDRTACTVDGCHPNDLGFYRMACTIGEKVKSALAAC